MQLPVREADICTPQRGEELLKKIGLVCCFICIYAAIHLLGKHKRLILMALSEVQDIIISVAPVDTLVYVYKRK